MKTLNSVLMAGGLVAAVIPAASMANDCRPGNYSYATYVKSTLVSKMITYTSHECKVGDQLEISRISHAYPLLGQLEVDYWKGSYLRPAHVREVYRDVVLTCVFDEYVASYFRESTYETKVPFFVDNPNLRDDMTVSYVANAPMTDEEAQVAFEKTLKTCQEAK